MAQTTVAINLEAKTKGTESVKSLKAQIREATNEAIAIAAQFGEFSDEALQAAKRVAELKDQMQDFQLRVQALNPDKFEAIGKVVGGLANGIQAAQGAMALFGSESEDVQKALLRVQGAMALAQGTQGLIDAGNQFRALGQSALTAFNTIKTAIMTSGIGAILLFVGAVTTAIAVISNVRKATKQLTDEQIALNGVSEKADEILQNQYSNSLALVAVLNDTNQSLKNRKIALGNLQKDYPGYLKNIDIEKTGTKELAAASEILVQSIYKRAKAEAALDKLKKIAAVELEIRLGKEERAIKLQERLNDLYAQAGPGFQNQVKAEKDMFAQREANADKTLKSLEGQRAALLGYIKDTGELTSTIETTANTADKKTAEVKKKALTREQLFNKLIGESAKQREQNDKTIEDETKKRLEQKEARETAMREYRIERAFEEVELNKKLAAEQIELEKRKEEAIQKARLDGLQGAANVLDALAGLMKQGSDAQKAFALASIAADSAKAISATILEARNTAKNMTQMGVPAPFPQIAAGAVYASGVAMVLNNIKKAKDILNGGNMSASAGGGGGGIPPAAPVMTPITGGALPDEQQFGGMGRVYVLEGDITKTQTRVRRLRNTSVV